MTNPQSLTCSSPWLVQAGVDVLWLQPATHLTVNPLPHLRAKGSGLTLAAGMVSRSELLATAMYVGGVYCVNPSGWHPPPSNSKW